MINVRELIAKFDPDASIKVSDARLIAAYVDNPDFPFLVSFPRTGSHWLRMMMELYFEKPSLVRIFYFRDSKDFTCYHTHDEDLQVGNRRDVIYLYRDPIDTVYSQLKYYKEDVTETARIDAWAILYGRHLKKWLYDEISTTKKTVLRYEGLKADLPNEFGKITDHFGVELDKGRLENISEQVSKSALKKKTAHDKQVVNLDPTYVDEREQFRANMGRRVRDAVLAIDSRLSSCFA